MVGSVIHQEMLLGGRRNRLYALRWVYVGWLVLQIFFLWIGYMVLEMEHRNAILNSAASAANNPASAPGVVGSWFVQGVDGDWLTSLIFPGFVRSQMVLLLLATPAFVAGAVTDEKRRGTLQYLITADLDMRHLILGKMFGRVAQVGLLTLAGLPLFALMAGFAGIEPVTVVAVVVVLLAPMFALSAATILASVLCKQTSDAVLLLYAAGLLGYAIVALVGGPLQYLDPIFVLEPAWAPWSNINWSELSLRLSVEVAAWGVFGCACLVVAVWRLRPVYLRELEGPSAKPAWYQGERVAINDDPVQWRERYVERLMPGALKAFLTPVLLLPYGLVAFFSPKSASGRAQRLSLWPGILLTAAFATASSLTILAYHLPAKASLAGAVQAVFRRDVVALTAMMPTGAEYGFELQGLVVMLIGSFIVGVRCSGSITGEREKQTWEAVLLTPLSAAQLVRAKLWGVMGASYWYLLAYAIPAVLLSALGGLASLLWTLVWLAVTVLAMYFIGAAAIWSSARSKTSWRSLLHTMAGGYLLGTFLYLFGAIFVSILTAIVNAILQSIDNSWGTHLYTPPPTGATFMGMVWWFVTCPPFVAFSCVALGLIFVLLPQLFLRWAQRWIADRERTRHWYDEPIYRRARGEPMYPVRQYR
jgi:ABC-type transport system involved in multi-copper enzyme maturation permease subunit